MSERKTLSKIDQLVGQMVRKRRRELSLTQEQLGEHLGVRFQQIQKYEKGVSRISAGRLYEISIVLGVSVEYFYAGAEYLAKNLSCISLQQDYTTPQNPSNKLSVEAREIGELYMRVQNSNLRKQFRASMEATIEALSE